MLQFNDVIASTKLHMTLPQRSQSQCFPCFLLYTFRPAPPQNYAKNLQQPFVQALQEFAWLFLLHVRSYENGRPSLKLATLQRISCPCTFHCHNGVGVWHCFEGGSVEPYVFRVTTECPSPHALMPSPEEDTRLEDDRRAIGQFLRRSMQQIPSDHH